MLVWKLFLAPVARAFMHTSWTLSLTLQYGAETVVIV
jgi:hypothetical protein